MGGIMNGAIEPPNYSKERILGCSQAVEVRLVSENKKMVATNKRLNEENAKNEGARGGGKKTIAKDEKRGKRKRGERGVLKSGSLRPK